MSMQPCAAPSVRRWQFALGGAVVVAVLLAAFHPGIAPDAEANDEACPAPAAAPADELTAGGDEWRAPELDGGSAWLNTAGPVRLADLKGRIVLLDFWTLCCINCIHTLPDLAKLEAKYPGILVVLGIHIPKFPNEANTDSIRKAILRYQIKHPVVNDAKAIISRRYGFKSWPTLILIDPEGKYYGQISGEGAYDVLDQHIEKLAKQYRAKKMLKE